METLEKIYKKPKYESYSKVTLPYSEHPVHKGYYRYRDTGIFVNLNSDIFNSRTNTFDYLANRRPIDDYYFYSINPKERVWTAKIVTDTFFKVPKDLKRLLTSVNHINGNKRDDRVVNLELVDKRGNILHARETGLMGDNQPLKVLNLATGKITEFVSYSEAARFFNCTTEGLRKIDDPFKVRFGHYLVGKVGESFPTDWEKMKYVLPEEIVTYYKKDNKFVIWSDSKQVEKDIGIHVSYQDLLDKYDNGIYQLDLGDYVVMTTKAFFEGRFAPEKPVNDVSYSRLAKFKNKFTGVGFKPAKPIEVINTNTGNKVRYGSSQEFADEIGVNKKSFQKHIKRTGGFYKQYIVKYLES